MSVNRPIPALYQGVSQQPPSMRALEQVEALENGYLTVADGDRKRPPLELVKKLTASVPNNALVHQYSRGDGEEYAIIVNDLGGTGQVRVYDRTTGLARTVNVTGSPLTYLYSANCIDDIGAYTVADTTFLWNRTKTVATLASAIAAQTPKLFVFIKEGRPDSSYSVQVAGTGGGTATFTTGSTGSSYSSVNIATQLNTAITALGGGSTWVVTQNGSLLVIRRADNADFAFEAYDTNGSTMVTAFKNRVERYSDLPRQFVEGQTVEVRGQGDSAKTAFWVQFIRGANTQIGHWEETVAPNPGEATALDPATMPVKLVRQADGTFTLSAITWATRLVGSTVPGSAPPPSFVGGKINSLFIGRGRMGILSGENAVLSRVDDFFNYWPKSVTVVSDSDPIDGTANSPKVSVLRHGVPFQRQIVLFSDSTQFALSGGTDALTPKNARIDPITEFDCSALVEPVSSGNDLFFVFERASSGATFSGVREYTVNQNSVTNVAVDLTAHVPQFIPRNVHGAAVSSTEDLLLLISKNEWNRIYWYKYLWSGDKKVQSAWGRWTFRPSDKVLSAVVEKTTVFVVLQRTDGVYLFRMNLQSTATTNGLPFAILLDDLTSFTALGYDALRDETTIALPYTVSSSEGTVQVVAGGDFARGAGSILPYTPGLIGTQIIKGNWTGGTLYCGVTYEHRTTLSEQFMRDSESVAIQKGRLQLKHLTVSFRKAVTFRIEVATPGRDTAKYTYTALQLGIFGSIIGSPVTRSGSFTAPVGSRSDRATISIVNDSPYPATFYGAEWEGEFTTRTGRR